MPIENPFQSQLWRSKPNEIKQKQMLLRTKRFSSIVLFGLCNKSVGVKIEENHIIKQKERNFSPIMSIKRKMNIRVPNDIALHCDLSNSWSKNWKKNSKWIKGLLRNGDWRRWPLIGTRRWVLIGLLCLLCFGFWCCSVCVFVMKIGKNKEC